MSKIYKELTQLNRKEGGRDAGRQEGKIVKIGHRN